MISLYKEISEEILAIVRVKDADENQLSAKLDKRQAIIDGLNENELKRFRASYIENELHIIDKEIKANLEEQILNVKKELIDYKTKKAVNTAYANMNKNNLNLFSKKV